MTPTARAITSIFLVLLVAHGVTAWAENDAGTHADAANTEATATPLPSYGKYWGNLTPRDQDWYTVAAPGGSDTTICTSADVTGTVIGEVDLVVRSGPRTSVARATFTPAAPYTPTIAHLSLAAPVTDATDLGVIRTNKTFTNWYWADEEEGSVFHRPYTFTLAAQNLSTLTASPDAGTGRDASSSASGATPVMEAGCFGGTLSPLAVAGDVADMFAFQGTAGDVLTYSFAQVGSPATQLTVVGPSGAVAPTVLPGGVQTIQLGTTGTYYYRTSTNSNTAVGTLPYVVAGSLATGNPCDPFCVVLR